MINLAPEALTFTTSHADWGGDDVLIQRSSFGDGAVAFLQIEEEFGGKGSAFLTLGELRALVTQGLALLADAEGVNALAHRLDPEIGARVDRIQGVA